MNMREVVVAGVECDMENTLEISDEVVPNAELRIEKIETITQTEFGEANRVNLEYQKVIHDQGIKIKKLQQLNDELIKSAKVTEKIIKFMSAENRALRNEK